MSFVCPICSETHEDLQRAIGHNRPDYWLSLTPEQQARGQADDDRCASGDGHFFVRCVLRIPINDGPIETLEFGPWSSLSEKNFWRYCESYHEVGQSRLGAMFGWLSNELRGFPGSFGHSCQVRPQDDGQRPVLLVDAGDSELSLAQRDGIPFTRALEILHPFL